jgi:hypothetical protein
MHLINITKLKQAFHREGIQLGASAVNLLEDEMNRIVDRWVSNTKHGNVRRLTAELMWVAFGKWTSGGDHEDK